MSLDGKKLAVYAGLLGWAMIAFFSLWNIWKVFSYSCYFISFWPACNANSNINFFVRGIVITIIVALLIASGFFWYKIFDKQENSSRMLGILVFISACFAFLMLPFTSTDLQYYFSVGKADSSGINTYTQSWTEPNFFYFPQSNTEINGVMYGPLAVMTMGVVYKVSAENYINFAVVWKIFMFIIFGICGYLTYYLISLFGVQYSKKVFYCFWITQPLLLWEWIGNGHFDGLWLISLLLAFIFAVKNKWWAVIIVLTLGVWIKFIPLLVTPWFVLWWWQGVAKDNWHKKIIEITAASIASAFLTYLIWKPYWHGLTVFKSILLQSKWAVSSFFSVIYYSLRPLFDILFISRAHWILTRLVQSALLVFAIYMLYPYLKKAYLIIFKKLQAENIFFIKAVFISLLIYLMVWQKSLWPWYLCWLIPVGLILYVINKNEKLKKILIWLSLAPLLFYLPQTLFPDSVDNIWFFSVAVLIMAAYPIGVLCSWRKNYYDEYGKCP